MIQTKVARVVSPTELILAAGAEDGVEEGMEFIVYSLSDPVTDPDTGRDLGRIEVVKAKLIAAHVQDRITIARTKSRTVKRVIDAFEEIRRARSQRYETTQVVNEQMAVDRIDAIFTPDLVVRMGDSARTVAVKAKSITGELVAT